MRHGQGTRYNTDVHNAVSTIKKYNADQEIDEAPYGIGQRVGDTLKGFVPGGMGRMAKGRKESGKMANELNKQWQSHLGKKGLKDQSAATVQDLSDFIERLAPGTNASAFYQKAGISAENPASVVPKKSQEAIILSLAQSMNAQVPRGGTTTDTTDTTGTTGTTDAGSKAQSAVDFAKRATGAKARTTGAPETGGTARTTGTTSAPADSNTKQAKIIDFVSKLNNAQKTELRRYIRNAMSSRATRVGH